MKYDISFTSSEVADLIREKLKADHSMATTEQYYDGSAYSGWRTRPLPVVFSVIVDGQTFDNVEITAEIKG